MFAQSLWEEVRHPSSDAVPLTAATSACLALAQVYEGGTELPEAKDVMDEHRRFIRSQPGGSGIIVAAAKLGKAATPQISLIFNETTEMAYSTARVTSES